METILVTGSNGLLGQKLTDKLLNNPDFNLIATSRGANRHPVQEGYTYRSLDITREGDVRALIADYRPRVIINTAAMTNVDACEKDSSACDQINVDAVRYLSAAAAQTDAHLIQLSTDFIFNGENGPYREEDHADPLSHYGWSKLRSEQVLRDSLCTYAILRTILVYGISHDMTRSNIVLWAKGALEKGDPINVVNDQFRMPTLAEDLADACLLAAGKRATGIYHISGKESMSILQLVERVADFWGLDKSLVNPTSSAVLNQRAKRPPRTGFVLDKAIRDLGYHPRSFEEGLALVAESLSAGRQA